MGGRSASGLGVTLAGAVLAVVGCWGSVDQQPGEPAPGAPATYVPTPAVPPPAPRATTPARLRRLTGQEMENVYADLLGQRLRLARGFLPDPRAEGFDNDAGLLGVGESKAEEILTAAERVAAALAAPATLPQSAPCPAEEQHDVRGCAGRFARRATAIAWGRGISAGELERLLAVFDVGASGAAAGPAPNYAQGISLLAEAVLVSPHFVYRFELGEPVAPGSPEVQLTGPEIASALSFLLRGSRPDAALAQQAALGTLTDPEVRAAEARRLLAEPAGRGQLTHFLRAWLGLLDVSLANKDLAVFPLFVPAVRQAVERELDTFLDHVLGARQGRLPELLLADYTFPGRVLEPIYGSDALDPIGDFTPVQLAPHRRGLLTSPAFLAVHALVNQTNPVERGLLVRNRLLCQDVAPPPPEVLDQPPGGGPELTTRNKYEAHTRNPSCAACHRLIDPLGFGFENFDAVGRHRTHEGKHPVDASGEVLGTDVDGPFVGPAELAARLVNSAQFRRCFVQQLYRFAAGRPLEPDDAPEIDYLTHRLASADQRIGDLVIALVQRPTFVLRRAAVEAAP